MKLYSVTLTAWRIENDQPVVGMRNVVALLLGDAEIGPYGVQEAEKLFPTADGWHGQGALWEEITQGMPVGPFRLTWQVEPAPAAESEGAEQ